MRRAGQFRDKTAMEVLAEGEREAMEGLGGAALAMAKVAGDIDAKFAWIYARFAAIETQLRDLRAYAVAIEDRLKALEGQLLRPTPANHGDFGPTWDTDRLPGHVSEELRQKLAREAYEAVPGRTGVGGVVSAAAGEADVEQLPQNRDAEGGAVETGGQVPLSSGGGTSHRRDDG